MTKAVLVIVTVFALGFSVSALTQHTTPFAQINAAINSAVKSAN